MVPPMDLSPDGCERLECTSAGWEQRQELLIRGHFARQLGGEQWPHESQLIALITHLELWNNSYVESLPAADATTASQCPSQPVPQSQQS